MSPGLRVRRAVVLFPSGLTLFNLFFGVFAIIAASRGQFQQAGWFIVLGGVCDALDGRVARATATGGRFGEELDSLVDVVSFGLAPAMIMYFAVLNKEGWDWFLAFFFVACAALRLARFNVEQAGSAKTYFQGLPSPAAGITLATYYWFSQTPLYTETAVGNLPWHQMLRFVMIGLSILMVSNVPYPVLPPIGFRTVRGWVGIAAPVLGLGMLIFGKLEYFFPLAVAYVAFGLARGLVLGLMERRTGAPATHTGHMERGHREYPAFDHPRPQRHSGARAAGLDLEDGRGPSGAGGQGNVAGRRRNRRRRGRSGPGTGGQSGGGTAPAPGGSPAPPATGVHTPKRSDATGTPPDHQRRLAPDGEEGE